MTSEEMMRAIGDAINDDMRALPHPEFVELRERFLQTRTKEMDDFLVYNVHWVFCYVVVFVKGREL